MEHSPYFDFFSIQYKLGLSKTRLKTAVVKTYIRDDEYLEICGEVYA